LPVPSCRSATPREWGMPSRPAGDPSRCWTPWAAPPIASPSLIIGWSTWRTDSFPCTGETIASTTSSRRRAIPSCRRWRVQRSDTRPTAAPPSLRQVVFLRPLSSLLSRNEFLTATIDDLGKDWCFRMGRDRRSLRADCRRTFRGILGRMAGRGSAGRSGAARLTHRLSVSLSQEVSDALCLLQGKEREKIEQGAEALLSCTGAP
jgi:hypothetical protein